jgi:hypothetical protein
VRHVYDVWRRPAASPVAAGRSIRQRQPLSGRLRAWQTSSVTGDLICSAKGCRHPAMWALRWNNPKLHPPERRKTWLACDDHLSYLTNFLDARGFLRETEPAQP